VHLSRKKLYAAVAGVVVLVAAVTLGLVFGLSGGQTQSTAETQASLPSAGGPNEAVQVHGHWTIDVMNPDGTLASHSEFENALAGGEYFLSGILAHKSTVGPWEIQLVNHVLTNSPFINQYGHRSQGIVGETCPSCTSQDNYFLSLTVSKSSLGKLVLKGNATAQADGTIDQVSTWTCTCLPSVAPNDCGWSNSGSVMDSFTGANITPVDVVAGQQILVQVEISFQ